MGWDGTGDNLSVKILPWHPMYCFSISYVCLRQFCLTSRATSTPGELGHVRVNVRVRVRVRVRVALGLGSGLGSGLSFRVRAALGLGSGSGLVSGLGLVL